MNPKRRLTRHETRQVTRTSLIKAAEKAIIRLGLPESSIEQISELAGFSRGAFYSNFADKDELLLAVIDNQRSEVSDVVQDIFHRISDGEKRPALIREWLLGLWRHKDRIALHVEFSHRAIRNAAVRKRFKDFWRHEVETYTQSVTQYCAAAGIAPAIRPQVVAVALLALREGLGNMAIDGASNLENVYAEAASLVFAALMSPPDICNGDVHA
jgi:AcrR family transcriptional regulator